MLFHPWRTVFELSFVRPGAQSPLPVLLSRSLFFLLCTTLCVDDALQTNEGLTQFHPYDFQEKLINNFHGNRFNICKMPRQTGKSTTVVSYLLHYAVFNDSVNIGILANKGFKVCEMQ